MTMAVMAISVSALLGLFVYIECNHGSTRNLEYEALTWIAVPYAAVWFYSVPGAQFGVIAFCGVYVGGAIGSLIKSKFVRQLLQLIRNCLNGLRKKCFRT